jgi:hypothetical protein
MARNVEEAANFVSVQLIEQEPGIYDKCHADYARQDKIDLVWERTSQVNRVYRFCVYLRVSSLSATMSLEPVSYLSFLNSLIT